MSPADSRQDPLIGQVLQQTYQVRRRIAAGGMGVVYEAAHLRLSKKRYAVKVLLPSASHDAVTYARFRREAEITSELGHPNIVDVQDFNQTDDGRPYLVMEFLDGQDMGHYLTEVGRVPPPALVAIMLQVGSALQVAHEHGVVHRDIKPANIFLADSSDGEVLVKVLDFGISKISHSQSVLTAQQSVLGTVHYMSPEQAEGEIQDIDHTTDIFALGTICYQALSGLLPFTAPTMPGVIYQIVHRQQEPLAGLFEGLPPAVDQALSRALTKQKQGRYERVVDFTEALAEALDGVELLEASSSDRVTSVMPVPADPRNSDPAAQTVMEVAEAPAAEAPASGDTEYMPLEQALAEPALPITGPPLPETRLEPVEQELPAPSPGTAEVATPARFTTLSSAAGQPARRSREGRLRWPLILFFWCLLAAAVFLVVSGPRDLIPTSKPPIAGITGSR